MEKQPGEAEPALSRCCQGMSELYFFMSLISAYQSPYPCIGRIHLMVYWDSLD